MFKIHRRQFLQFALNTTAGVTIATITSPLRAMEVQNSHIEMKAWTPEGKPLDTEKLNGFYFLNLNDEPFFSPTGHIEAGRLFAQPPPERFAIALKMPVAGFGEVTLYADNNGQGYLPGDFPLNLNLAFARSRLYRVRTAVNNWQLEGFKFSEDLKAQLERAEAYLKKAEATEDIIAQIWYCNQSLFESLWAGEKAVFTKAKQQIPTQPRPNFLFGCNFFHYDKAGEKYRELFKQLFKQLFNFATIPFYWSSFEPQPGKPNYARTDAMVNWLQEHKITAKGHPLVWFHPAGIPEWLREKSYEEIKQLTYERVKQITAHYGNKIPYYDIINEANGIPWANDLGYSFEQFLELTQIASEASKAGNTQVMRIINNYGLWAENVAYGEPPQQSPYEYLKACIAADIDFEIIGLQFYYPQQDMFEIDRMLERFSKLGKPIHITELGVASSAELDEQAYLQEPKGMWHKPWSEEIQADWVEQFYTLCYSKSYIQAITWWDFIDQGNFWPHGGLLHQDLTPKQSFYRLSRLLRRWRQ